MATWSRADETYPAKGAWAGQPIEAMAHDARGADKAAAGAGIKSVVPVGEAFTRAMQTGIADPNSYDGIDAGKSEPVDLRQLPRQHLRVFTSRRWWSSAW